MVVQVITALAYLCLVIGLLLLAYLIVTTGRDALSSADEWVRSQLREFVTWRTLRHLQRQAMKRHV